MGSMRNSAKPHSIQNIPLYRTKKKNRLRLVGSDTSFEPINRHQPILLGDFTQLTRSRLVDRKSPNQVTHLTNDSETGVAKSRAAR
ncbi:hypothetical protein TNIN_4931 [Trichonephila inaurata madagascariensis]|uniref:Uncharacterized protein n=1 Tax=Trichonephila inaurata madagascariensis TaxID=2747483 RepID=A0A8X6WX45_9ARAC|nr:hypothetical protein TNIN_4931 [Trichonephila inaurata madagascariensis]